MKICHVNFARGFRGGERQTQLLIEALSERGLEQALLARHDSPLFEKLASIPNLTLLPARKPYLRYIGSTVSEYRPDIVHAHEAKAAQWTLLNYWLQGTPYMMTRRMSRPSKNVSFTRAVYRNAARVVALSSSVRDGIHSLLPGLPVEIIPSMFASLPVDPARVKMLRDRYAGKFVIGHVGALVNPHKGQVVLIKAIKLLNRKYRDLKILLLGSGRDELMLKRLAHDTKNIEFVGFVEDVGNWIGIFDLFVFPSLEEGLGSSLLDVMQQGKPIVASRVGGIIDVIQDRQNGILIPSNDPKALADTIEEMYLDPSMRERYGAAGLASLDRYSPARVARSYHELYSSILGG
jgi:glycosyltransferase involved in cell wall biosynthesis